MTIYGLEMRFEGGEMVEAEAAFVDWWGMAEATAKMQIAVHCLGEALAEALRQFGEALIRLPEAFGALGENS